jgi:hypothetical protein
MAGILRSFRGWSSVSDDEFIEGVRRMLSQYDRHRPWLIKFHATALAGFIGAAVFAVVAIQWILRIGAANLALGLFGVGVGMAFGVSLGMGMFHSIHILMDLISSMRSERLLIKYHDAVEILLAERRAEEERSADAPESLPSS